MTNHHGKVLLLCAFWSFFAFPLHAQWTLQVKNLRGNNYNTRLFLGYKPSEEQPKQFLADISIRPLKLEASYVTKRLIINADRSAPVRQKREDKQYVGDFHLDPSSVAPIFLRKEVELSAQGEEVFFVDLKLPVNHQFQIDVDVKDIGSSEHVLLKLEEPFLVHNDVRLQTSDLFLSFSHKEKDLIQKPFLEKVVKVDEPILYYGIYLYAKNYDVLRVRPILAKEKPNPEVPSTQVFESIGENLNKIVRPQGRQQVLFRDTLELSDLDASTYTLWVLIEAGGDEKLERVGFIKGSDISKRIYEDLDQSIQMMSYITSGEKISEMMKDDMPGIKLNRFNKAWQRLYGESAQTEMQLYYQKIYEAEEKFIEGNVPGWKTDRGKIYVLYGEPEGVSEVNIKGKPYLRWIYPSWSLSFLFWQDGERWNLLERSKR